jgi:hypothetical protein
MVADADTERAMGKDSLGSVDGTVERDENQYTAKWENKDRTGMSRCKSYFVVGATIVVPPFIGWDAVPDDEPHCFLFKVLSIVFQLDGE